MNEVSSNDSETRVNHSASDRIEELRQQQEPHKGRQSLRGEALGSDVTGQQQRRDVVMVVGSTGYFGKGVVSELRRQKVPLRLLGRSRASLEAAGYLAPSAPPPAQHDGGDDSGSVNDATGQTRGGGEANLGGGLECVVCRDTSDPRAYDREWFRDVRLVVCVARPRSAMRGQDHGPFLAMVPALCHAVRANRVPHLLLLGLPYVESFPLGTHPRIVMPQAEASAKEILSSLPSSSLVAGSPFRHTKST